MNELEQRVIEKLVDQAARRASPAEADEIRELREDLLAMRLVNRVPNPKPPVYQHPLVPYIVLIALVLIASLLGLEIPLARILGGN